jgi:hypothetical protein
MARIDKLNVTLSLNIPKLGDAHLQNEEPDELTKNSIAIVISGLQKAAKQVEEAFVNLGMEIKPYSTNNYRKRHGIPKRRKVR